MAPLPARAKGSSSAVDGKRRGNVLLRCLLPLAVAALACPVNLNTAYANTQYASKQKVATPAAQLRAPPGSPSHATTRIVLQPSAGQSWKPQTKLPTSTSKGLAADIFKVPRGWLKCDFYRCRDTYSFPQGCYHTNGAGDKIVLCLQPHSVSEKCTRMQDWRVTHQQYAELVQSVLQQLSWKRFRSGATEGHTILHQRVELRIVPKFSFAAFSDDNGAYVGVMVKQEILAPDSLNLGRTKKQAAARLAGLRVRPCGSRTTMEICDCPPVELTEAKRSELLTLTQREQSRRYIEQALTGTLVLCVSINCQDSKFSRLDYVASAICPTFDEDGTTSLREAGILSLSSVPAAKLILPPARRRALVEEELESLRAELSGAPLERLQAREGSGTSASMDFGALPAPQLLFSSGVTRQLRKNEGNAWDTLVKHGPYRPLPALPRSSGKEAGKRQLVGIMCGNATQREKGLAQAVLDQVSKQLKVLGTGIEAQEALVEWSSPPRDPNDVLSVQSMLKSTRLPKGSAVLLFRTASLGQSQKSSRTRSLTKFTCLAQQSTQKLGHIVSQWIDLEKPVWAKAATDPLTPRVVALGIFSKLGAFPWALNISSWFLPGARTRAVVVAGWDVCHNGEANSWLPLVLRDRCHTAAGIRVSSTAGLALNNITEQWASAQGETTSEEFMRRILLEKVVAGKVVFIHRDGRFKVAEKEFLRRYREELAEHSPATTFVLVELVKWAGGTPRLYLGDTNPSPGTFLQISDTVAILVNTQPYQGTSNPLAVELSDIYGPRKSGLAQGLEACGLRKTAWLQSVHDLSLLNHGTLIQNGKLPVTTHFSDKLAYEVTQWGSNLTSRNAVAPGWANQFWL